MARDATPALTYHRVGRVIYGADAIVRPWVKKHIGMPFRDDPTDRALGVIRGKELIAGVAYSAMNRHNVMASIASTNPRWASRDVLRQIHGFAFNEIGVDRITVLVASSNRASMDCARRLGFRIEGAMIGAAHDGTDLIALRMFRNECIWLGGGNGQGC